MEKDFNQDKNQDQKPLNEAETNKETIGDYIISNHKLL